MRVSVRVRPGSSRTAVGGRHAGSLVVAVTSPAVEGRATLAVVEAVAKAFGVRRSQVGVVAGERSRTKVLDIEGEESVLARRLADLLGPAPGPGD